MAQPEDQGAVRVLPPPMQGHQAAHYAGTSATAAAAYCGLAGSSSRRCSVERQALRNDRRAWLDGVGPRSAPCASGCGLRIQRQELVLLQIMATTAAARLRAWACSAMPPSFWWRCDKTSARGEDLRAQGEDMARRSRCRPARATGLLGSKVPTHDAAGIQKGGQVRAAASLTAAEPGQCGQQCRGGLHVASRAARTAAWHPARAVAEPHLLQMGRAACCVADRPLRSDDNTACAPRCQPAPAGTLCARRSACCRRKQTMH